jgi:betaine-aldehyde dehydrogenase
MPDDPNAAYGALNNEAQLHRVSGFIRNLPDHATVRTGGAAVGERGYFYAPTVVSGLQQNDDAIQQEILSMYGLEDYTRIKHVMSNIEE